MLRRQLYRLFLPFVLSSCLLSCHKAYITFGNQYVDNNITNLVMTDTLSTELSTVFLDSVATSGTGTALAGYYADSIFGKITVSPTFPLAPPALFTLGNTATFDSMVLILRPAKSYYGDTTKRQQLNVYQLTDTLAFATGNNALYSTTNFPYNPTPLGQFNQLIYPSLTDSLVIRMDNAKGQEMFDLFKNQDQSMSSAEFFNNYFKGIKIIPVPGSSSAVFGFKDSVILRINYHETGVAIQNKKIDFTLFNRKYQYNQVTDDRSGTVTAAFGAGKNEIPSSATNGQAFMQFLTGMEIKVRFPTLRNLLQAQGYYSIQKAQLIINPVPGTFNGQFPLPPDLQAVTTTVLNLPGAPLTAPGPSGANTIENGNLQTDPIYGVNNYYTYDVTQYLQGQIGISAANGNGLLFYPLNALNTSLNRLVIGDKSSKNAAIQLKVFYVSIQN